jgi:hypothetical protein
MSRLCPGFVKFVTLVTLLLVLWFPQVQASSVIINSAAPPEARISLLSDSRGDVVLEFQFGVLQVDTISENGSDWVIASIAGAGLTSDGGRPELPQMSAWIELPGSDPSLTVEEHEQVLRNFGTIRPAAEPAYRSSGHMLRRLADPDYYTSRELYPVQLADVSVHGDVRNSHLALVTFNPVQYRARSGEWTIHTRIRVRIHSTINRSLDQRSHESRSGGSLASRVVLNPHPDNSQDTLSGPRMILVTDSSFLAALEPFIAWKNRSGVLTRTVLYSSVATTPQGLRDYLRTLCASLTPTPEFLLLVGDVNVIPPFSGVNSTLTDHPYSLLTDTDYLPDISVGRIPAQSAAACSSWVARLLASERDVTSETGIRGCVFSSREYIDPQHGTYVSGLFGDAGLTVDQLQEPQTGTLPLLLSALNDGPKWSFYIGHGIAQGWTSVHAPYTASEAATLTANQAPIIVSVACATADLDYPGSSLAERWLLRTASQGALAYIGATEDTPFFRSDTLGIGVLRAVFLQRCERLGQAVDWGRLAVTQCFPQAPGGLTEMTIQQFELLGDPSMRVFSQPAQPLTVSCPTSLSLEQRSCTVTVQQNGAPVAAAEICLKSDDNLFYVVRYSDSLGQVVLPIHLSQAATLQLTVSARNAVPYLGELRVIGQASTLPEVAAVQFADPDGDHDGLADRGENGQVILTVANRGDRATAACVARVSCADSRVSVAGQTVPVSPLAPGDSLMTTAGITLAVVDSVADLSTVLLRIVLLASDDSSVMMQPLTLHAPVLRYISSTLREDSGNGDGNPDAGEILRLELQFVNSGSDRAHAPACSLWALPEGIHCENPRWTTTVLQASDTARALYRLRIESTVPRGYPAEFTYQIAARNAPPLTGWDSQRIGRVPVFLYVLDPTPASVDAVAAALTSLGVEYERGTVLPTDLSRYASLWIFCGIFPNKAALPEADATRISRYLDQRGRCYWEGGDVWAFDPPNELRSYFHIRGLSDGTSNAGPIDGLPGTWCEGMHFDYSGENSFIDQLAPDSSATVLLNNAHPGSVYGVGIGFESPLYRTIGSSVELGALADALPPSTRLQIFSRILDWFGIPVRSDNYPPVILHNPIGGWYMANQPIPISADVQDASGIETVSLEYRVNDGMWQSLPMVCTDGIYVADIPGMPFDSEVEYRLSATDNSPGHNRSETEAFTFLVSPSQWGVYWEDFADLTSRDLRPRIHDGGNGSWALTSYPESVPTLELHGNGQDSPPITFTTGTFDCSTLQSAGLSFYHYLRDGENRSGVLARVVGSTDGGANWTYTVWTHAREGGGVLDEGTVVVDSVPWMAGQSAVCLRFEFTGEWYWRLRDIRVQGTTAPVLSPVRDMVIGVAPEGIQLVWSPVPLALGYSILASSESLEPNAFEPIAEVRDTIFIDTDPFYSRRFYQAKAILKYGTAPDSAHKLRSMSEPPMLRVPDLIWNRKLNNSIAR